MAYRGLTQRITRMERRHTQSTPHVHIVWLEAGEGWDGNLSALGETAHVIVLPHKAATVEAWTQAVRQRHQAGA
jgi:hypothetical protein